MGLYSLQKYLFAGIQNEMTIKSIYVSVLSRPMNMYSVPNESVLYLCLIVSVQLVSVDQGEITE